MLHRPLSPASGAFFDDAIPASTEAAHGRRPAVWNDGVVAEEVMARLAADRAEDASTALLGAALLMVAAAAVALASVGGDARLAVGAGVLCLTAIGLVSAVRIRLQRELTIVGEAHGIDAARARAEARRLAQQALRLE